MEENKKWKNEKRHIKQYNDPPPWGYDRPSSKLNWWCKNCKDTIYGTKNKCQVCHLKVSPDKRLNDRWGCSECGLINEKDLAVCKSCKAMSHIEVMKIRMERYNKYGF